MSKFLIYLHVEPYIRQWLIHSFGNPVEFPASSNVNEVIRWFSQKQPASLKHQKPSEDDVAICIPACKYKNPETYNYLSLQAKKALEESISDLFRINMWNDLGDLADTSCKKMSAFRAWCTMHGIDVEYAETVRMKWYRMRKSYQNKGVNLFNHKRCRK